MNTAAVLALVAVEIKDNWLVFTYEIDGNEHITSLNYVDLDFTELCKTYGEYFIRFLCVHIAVLEGFKYTSLFPSYYELYGFEQFITLELLDLFLEIQKKVFAQHRFENDNPHYSGPFFRYQEDKVRKDVAPVCLKPKKQVAEALVSCGGGKDSLLCMQILNSANIEFGTIQYSHTIYGEAEGQNLLIQTLSEKCNAKSVHILNNIESFMSSNILDDYEGIHTLCNAETPNGVFQSLFFSLQYGYRYLVVGHENSADDPNFIWKISKEKSEPVNHQWGKSLEAELLLCNYIKKYISPDIHFFSILKPIGDFLIMQALHPYEKLLPFTHSCNIDKPWCKQCPKCAYVWTNFLAYFDEDVINEIFDENPFDKAALYDIFLQMMGAKDHKPFECIGEIGETQLALHICIKKGMKGKVLDAFQEKFPALDFQALFNKYNQVKDSLHNFPPPLAGKIMHQFYHAQPKALEYFY